MSGTPPLYVLGAINGSGSLTPPSGNGEDMMMEVRGRSALATTPAGAAASMSRRQRHLGYPY